MASQLSFLQKVNWSHYGMPVVKVPPKSGRSGLTCTLRPDEELELGFAVRKKISAALTGRVEFTYVPETSDLSTKIVFIQVMRELLDGKPVKPSVLSAYDDYQDKDTTTDFYHVDYELRDKEPYLNRDNDGNALSMVSAKSHDGPRYDDIWFPKGTTVMKWEFTTAAFRADGKDKGKYYAYIQWAYEKSLGMPGKITEGSATEGKPEGSFRKAVFLWCDNHGFNLPSNLIASMKVTPDKPDKQGCGI